MPNSISAKALKDDSSLSARGRDQAPTAVAQPGSGNQILDLQQNVGNKAVSDLLQCGGDVTKLMSANLNISNPDDTSERNARQTASRLLSSPDSHDSRSAPGEKGQSSAPGSHRLPRSTRARFEPQLGVDLSHVRLHTDSQAASSAHTLNAKAFTLGSDIVFAQGQYSPETEGGQRVLAHELSHVAQQSHGEVSANTIFREDEPDKPKMASMVSQKFADLPDGQVVSDPTGAKHGITVIRRGDELFYHLPPPVNAQRQVPRPLEVKSGKRQPIKSISWGGGGISQRAFDVDFDTFDAPFTVNIFGVGHTQTLIDALFRKPAALETRPEGLEVEKKPGTLPQARPKGAAFRTAERYHIPGATFSMYVFSSRGVQVSDDTTGTKLWGPVDGKDLKDLQISPAGDVLISWDDPEHKGSSIFSVKFNLRGPTFSPTGLGRLEVSAERTALLGELKALKVKVVEQGSRFNELELEAAVDTLKRWQGKKGVVESLKANGVPGLTLIKDVQLETGGSYDDDKGEVKIPGGVSTTPAEERNVVIHELAHALFQANGFYPPKKGKTPEHIKAVAKDMHEDSDLDLIDEGAITGARVRKPRTQEQWEKALSSSEKLNKIWQDLHRRFPISDPEGTSDIRGLDVADESRYVGGQRGDILGHGFDNVNEFVASFVASSIRFQIEMTETIKNSKSDLLLILYRELWTLVNSDIVNLGTKNPYD
ncbi:MAG: DUF4157 domain-containing protein [Pyrinomonadaceae bacterium]|nr:DUF4157 domain-containing protein [Pyrinomonadaceae bacterium]